MADLAVYDRSGKQVGTYSISPSDVAPRINKQLLHDAVVMYQANKRQGTSNSSESITVASLSTNLLRRAIRVAARTILRGIR